jgi:preprotein translocase subunit YajC
MSIKKWTIIKEQEKIEKEIKEMFESLSKNDLSEVTVRVGPNARG